MVAPRETQETPLVAAGRAKPEQALPTGLQYEGAGRVAVSVRGFRLLVVLTLVNTVLLGSMVLGPQLFPFARQQWQGWKDRRAAERQRLADLAAQQKCLTHVAPASKVVFDEDPASAAALRKDARADYAPAGQVYGWGRNAPPPGWVPPARVVAPDAYKDYLRAVFTKAVAGGDDPVLFLHERTTPGGAKFLVCVQLNAQYGFSKQTHRGGDSSEATEVVYKGVKERSLSATWFPVAQTSPSEVRRKRGSRHLGLLLPDTAERVVARHDVARSPSEPPAVDYGHVLRFFAGQPDGGDASHFTIGYQLDGRDGVIDGWMRDEGLDLRPREGAPAYAERAEAWRLPAGTGAEGGVGAGAAGAGAGSGAAGATTGPVRP